MRRRRSRNIEIFNFSFLDILACTIGLLIFIMVMVFILQAGSPVADASAMVDRKQAAASAEMAAADRDSKIADAIEAQISRLPSVGNDEIIARRDAAQAMRDAAKKALDKATQDARLAQAELDASRQQVTANAVQAAQEQLTYAQKRFQAEEQALAAARATPSSNQVTFLPRHRPGDDDSGNFDVLHIDCRSEKVVILELKADGTVRQVGETPTVSLSDVDSAFALAIARHRLHDQALVLFWVRPDGMLTFEHAREAMPSGLTYGFEPADAKWQFGTKQVP